MSRTKHRFYRKILEIRNEVFTQGEVSVRLKIVTWCAVKDLTSRTVKTNHIAFSVYINNSKAYLGIEGLHPQRPVSINLKRPMESKYFVETLGKRRIYLEINQAFNQAYRKYVCILKDLKGRVLYFDRNRGEGMVKCPQLDTTFQVYACNLKGKRTWYAETACVYLNKDEEIVFNLAEVFSGVTVVNVQGHFDADKWNSLDHSSLAFMCDEDGRAINGLFA